MIENVRDEKISQILAEFEENNDSPKTDEFFMKAALRLAEEAAKDGEVPVGCVIVRNGKILTGDYNGRETFRDALYHAESAAIRKASQILGGWRLVGCTLYVTLEPCPMCGGAIWAARVPRVVIGAKDAKAGALGSMLNLNSYPLNHKPEVSFGVMERECRAVLQEFFAARRKKKMTGKTLFISDLDGTLLDKEARLPDGAAERINKLTESGVMITYATARTVRSVGHILGDIDFTLKGARPVALMNGVLVRDMAAGKYVRAAVIDRMAAEKIMSALDKIDEIEPFVYAIDEEHPVLGDPLCTYYRSIVNKPMLNFMDERVIRYGKPFVKIAALGEIAGDIIYFAILGGERPIHEAAAAVAGIGGIRYTYYRDAYADDVWYLEIFDGTASKKHAVEYLRDVTGAEEVVCFGDNMNDLPMFEAADIAVAVENAVGEVRSAADYVTADVIGFIEEYGGNIK